MKKSTKFVKENILKIKGSIFPEAVTDHACCVQEAMLPVLSASDVTYFYHERLYNNGKHYCLTTHPEALKHYYQHHFTAYKYGPNNLDLLKMERLIWSQVGGEDNEVYRFYAKNFNIANGLSVTERGIDYYDVFHFGGDYDNTGLVNHLINDPLMVNYFISYYKDKFRKLLSSASKSYVYKPSYKIDLSQCLESRMELKHIPDEMLKNVAALSIGSVKISKREYQVIYWLACGHTAEEVGSIMHISKRTVQTHIQNLKDKLACKNTLALVVKILAQNLIQYRAL